METINKAINKIKDGYLYAVDGIASHPHVAFWVGSVAIVVLAVL